MSVFNLRGSLAQNALVQQALDRCDFDFTKLLDRLAREGKQRIDVTWEDLSRYNQRAALHEHTDGTHSVVREVDGRMRVLGLFYLPPYTKIVLDNSLANQPLLAMEVFLAEAAHAVDYHYMTPAHRRLFVNSVHTQQLAELADVSDGAAITLDNHTCSWFDVNSYGWWVGEAFMQGFIEGTSDIPVTIKLNHPVGPEDRAVVRNFLGIVEPVTPEPEPTPEPTPEPELDEPLVDVTGDVLATALRRYLGTKAGARSPLYLCSAAADWLDAR